VQTAAFFGNMVTVAPPKVLWLKCILKDGPEQAVKQVAKPFAQKIRYYKIELT